jgi:DNA replication protein DnaC
LGSALKVFFNVEDVNASLRKAAKLAQKFVNDFPAIDKGLLFQGGTGVGKTKLLCAMATDLMRKDENIDIYYIDWNDLVREMRTGQDVTTRDFSMINQLIDTLSGVDVLLFDELGASRVSAWVQDYIYFLFNKRYNDNKVTICASNFFDKPSTAGEETLQQRIGNRIRSRLYEMTRVIEISGLDYRQENG